MITETPEAVEMFLVRFRVTGRCACAFEERIARPVLDAKVAEVFGARGTHRHVAARATSDYGGYLLASGRVVGDYFIVPGSGR